MGLKSYAALAYSGYQAKRATLAATSTPPPPACYGYTYYNCSSCPGIMVYYNLSSQPCCVSTTSGQRTECPNNCTCIIYPHPPSPPPPPPLPPPSCPFGGC